MGRFCSSRVSDSCGISKLAFRWFLLDFDSGCCVGFFLIGLLQLSSVVITPLFMPAPEFGAEFGFSFLLGVEPVSKSTGVPSLLPASAWMCASFGGRVALTGDRRIVDAFTWISLHSPSPFRYFTL